MMRFTDLIIIYLAFGAPFGAYFFFQNRQTCHILRLSLKSIIVGLVWIPTGFKLFFKFVKKELPKSQFAENRSADSFHTAQITQSGKVFANYFLKNNHEISLFSFRETFERYVGLTLSLPKDNKVIITDSDFFRITKHGNIKLGAICLQRRNRLRLESHQNRARMDLFQLFAKINSNDVESQILKSQAVEFFGILDDVEAQTRLGEIFRNLQQTENGDPVNRLEKLVWNSKKHRPSQATRTVLNLHPISAATLVSKPD